MSNKENLPPPSPSRMGCLEHDSQHTPPPGNASFTLSLRPWQTTAFASPPIRAISPSSKPVLNAQRDHSACHRPNTPLKIRKTRENLREFLPSIPPPCCYEVTDPCECASEHALPSCHTVDEKTKSLTVPQEKSSPARMQRQKSVSRRMLSKVKEGFTSRSKVSLSIKAMDSETGLTHRFSSRRKQSLDVERRGHSFEVSRDSIATISDFDLNDLPAARGPVPCSSIVPEHTELALGPGLIALAPPCPPTALPNKCSSKAATDVNNGPLLVPQSGLTAQTQARCQLSIPYVALSLYQDRSLVDSRSEQNVWVVVEASVLSGRYNISRSQQYIKNATYAEGALDSASSKEIFGIITSLRLCYRAVGGCIVVDVVGQKAVRNLSHGQQCLLFLKVHVPKLRSPSGALTNDIDSVFTEIESMIGTLEMEILQVEARYRTSLQPHDNVVTCRQIAKIRRPKLDSRWSILGPNDDVEDAENVHTRLAIYIADSRPPDQARKYFQQYLAEESLKEEPVKRIRQKVEDELATLNANNAQHSTKDRPEQSQPAFIVTCIDGDPSSESVPSTQSSANDSSSTHYIACVEPPAALSPQNLHTRIRSISLSAISRSSNPDLRNLQSGNTLNAEQLCPTNESQDAARKVWHHIRRTSLSTRQLTITPATDVDLLESSDEHLKALHSKALANKRSIGAETLKAWKWDHTVGRSGCGGEAPWL